MDDPTRWCENDASNGNAPSGAPDPKRGPHSFSSQLQVLSFQWKADLQFNAIGSITRRPLSTNHYGAVTMGNSIKLA